MAPAPVEFDAFETFDDAIVVFLGSGGANGVLVHRGGAEWAFFGPGSADWDDLHQAVFRNSRACHLTVEELGRRGIALPALDEYLGRPPGRWEDRFPAEMAAKAAPPGLRGRLERGALTVHLVLLEDRYETAFGDGKFLYAEAAFLQRAAADRWIQQKTASVTDPAAREWHEYTIKAVDLRLDRGRGVVVMEPASRYERYGVLDVVAGLAQA